MIPHALTTPPPAARPARRARPRRSLPALAVLLAAVTATACSTADASDDSAGALDTPVRGGTLTYLDAEIPVSAQVQESGYWQDRALLQNVTDRLIYRNATTNQLEPWIATSWKVSEGGRRYDFVIRSGVTYSDGTPLDVASVKRNLEWQIRGDTARAIAPNPVFPREATITTDPAASTVTVRLPQPYAPFLNVLTSWSAGLVADSTITSDRDAQTRFLNLKGSGPFVVTEETYGKRYVLSRRAGYAWAPKSSPNQGEAYVDKVVIVPVQEDSVRLGTLRSGQADLLRYVQPSEEKALTAQGFPIIARSGVGLSNQWFLRQTAPFVTDRDVRRALLVGIDRQALVESLYSSNWSAATGLLSPGTLGYRDDSAKLAYDPAAANALLDKAGWTGRDGEGYRTKDGQRLTLKTFVDVFDATARPLYQAVQAQLRTIGVHLDIHQTDYASYNAKAWADPKVATLRTGWPNSDPSVDLHQQYAGGWDVLGLKGGNPELKKVLEAPLTTATQDEQVAALAKAQDYLLDEAYAVPILNDTQVYVGGKGLRGFTLTDGALPEYHRAWLSR